MMSSVATLTMNPSIDISTAVAEVVPEHKLRCRAPHRNAGGGGINVARAIHALGGSAIAIYPAGGPTGAVLRTLLDQGGLHHSAIPIECTTRESLTVDEISTGRQYRFVLPGPSLTRDDWRHCLDQLSRLDPPPHYLIASGSLPPRVPDSFYACVGRIAKDLGARFVLDTSGPALAEGLDEGVFLVKPSLRELQQLMRADLSEPEAQERVCRELVITGKAQVVALSLGAEGALLTASGLQERVPAPKVRVRGTVGAGDSFVAGIVVGLMRGWPLDQAFRYAIAAGAAALLAPGTELCRRDDTDRLYEGLRRRAA